MRYGVSEIIEADRELVESGCEEMLDRAKDQPKSSSDGKKTWIYHEQQEIEFHD